MNRSYLLPILLLITVLISGCGEDRDENLVDFDLLAMSEGPHFDPSHIEAITSQSQFAETWDLYELEDPIPNVNFNEKNVYFIEMSGSSSCPDTIDHLATSKDQVTLFIFKTSPDGDCTADLVSYIYVIQVDKGLVAEVRDVKIVKKR